MNAPIRITTGDGANLLVADRWEPDGAAVGTAILLHGGGQTRHAWRQAARLITGHGWRAVTVDARGHGESAWPADGDYDHDRHVEDLFRILDLLGDAASRPVLIGASMGGMTSIIACGRYPDRFGGLVAVDVGLEVDTSESKRVRDFMRANPDGFATLEEAADAVQAYNPGRARPPSPDGLRRNLAQHPDGRWRWHWDRRMIERDIDMQAMEEMLHEAAAHITAPALLVRGTRSQMVSDAGVAHFRALVPQLRVVDVADAGHMVAGDDNDHFAEAVLDFLDSVAASQGAGGSA